MSGDYWAVSGQDDPRHVYVYDRNGSNDPGDWSLVGEGDIPKGQSIEDWGRDWNANTASLDHWTTPGDGDGGDDDGGNDDGGVHNGGDDDGGDDGEEAPSGPGDAVDDDSPDPAETPPDDAPPGEDDGGDDGSGDDDGETPGDDGSQDDGEGEDSSADDDEEGDGTADLQNALDELNDALSGVEDAIAETEEALADAEADADGLGEDAEAAREEADRMRQALQGAAGIGDDLDGQRADLLADLQAVGGTDPNGTPGPEGLVVAPPTLPATAGEPVLLYSGALVQAVVDLRVPSAGLDAVFVRHYHSQAFVEGPLGPKWRMPFHDLLRALPSGKVLRICEDFTQTVYAPDGAGGYRSAPGWPDLLERDGQGWRIRDGFGTVRRYDAAGRPVEVADRYGNALRFAWSSGRLRTVTDPGGRVYRFAYRSDGRLETLTAPDATVTRYAYDAGGRLVRVMPPAPAAGAAAATIGYAYVDGNDPRARHNLASIDEVGGDTDAFTIVYGTAGRAFNRVVSQRFEGAELRFDYLDGDGAAVERCVRATDRTGVVSLHDFDAAGRRVRIEVLSDGRSPDAPASWVTRVEYDPSGLIRRLVRPAGDVVEYAYDSGHADPLARQNLRAVVHRPVVGAADADSLIQRYRYGAFNQVVAIVAEDGRTTDFTVDAAGNTLAIRAPSVPRPGGGTARPTVAFAYDARGQVERRTDPNGLVTRFVRHLSGPRLGLIERIEEDDGNGGIRVVRHVLDPLGRTLETHAGSAVAQWTYDLRGRPVGFSRNGVALRQWDYSRHDRLLRTRDRRLEPDGTPSVPEWVDTVFEHGRDGRVRSSRVEAGGTVLQRIDHRYDGEGRPLRAIGPGRADQAWTYDERGIACAWTEAQGTAQARTARRTHDANGELSASTDTLGAVTRYERDRFGRLSATIDPLQGREEYELDAMGRTIAIRRRDAAGTLAAWVQIPRDALGRPVARRVAELDAAGAARSWLVESIAYDLENNPVRLVSATGATTTVEYDRFGDVVRQTDALGNVLRHERDAGGRLLATVREERMADGSVLALRRDFTHDADGRVSTATDAMGRSERFVHDARGRLRSWTRTDGIELATDYDALDRPVAGTLSDPSTGETWRESFAWDADGNLAAMTDALQRTTRFVHDRLGRPTRIVDPRGVVRQRFDWDAGDRLHRWRDARGVRVDQRFDALGRVLDRKITAAATVAGARNESYAYDALGNVVSARADAIATTAQYDSRGLRVSERQHGLDVRRSFDAAGRLQELRHPGDARVHYEHDALCRVRRIRLDLPAGAEWPGGGAAATIAEYAWSGRELRDSVRAAGTSVRWDHDALGRPMRLRVRRGSAVLADQLVVRDGAERVIAVDEAAAGARRLGYDARDQLRTIEPVPSIVAGRDTLVADARAGGAGAQATLEARIAALAATGATGWSFDRDAAGNLLRQDTPTASHRYAVDDADRMIEADGVAIDSDDDGAVRTAEGLDYAYDYAGRLCRVADASGRVLWEAQRDALGRIATLAAGGRRWQLVHDGSQAIEARESGGATRAWIRGALPSELALCAAAGADHRLLPDWHGNAGWLLGPDGRPRERYRYGPFGERDVFDAAGAPLPASPTENDIGYLMRPHLPGAPLVLAGARALHTGWGRFTTPDPSGFTDGPHLFLYAGGDPYSRSDRTGFSSTYVGAALGLAGGTGWAVGSMINAGLYEATDGNWGERWQGFGHYGSQIAQFTASGAMIGAAVDLAPVGGGSVSAGLMGAGLSGLFSAPGGDWGEWAGNSALGGAAGVAVWGVGRALTPVASAVLGPAASALMATGAGRAASAWMSQLGRTAGVSAVRSALMRVVNGMGQLAEQTPGNAFFSDIAGPAMRAHANRALAGQGMSAADLTAMEELHAQTMARLQTTATTWGGFRDAYWNAARQTPAFQQLFPNATGSGAPVYGQLGRLNIHHLHGRIRDLLFRESNLTLVPNALDTPFLHSARYLTGTQQALIRRGLRALFPRQWLSGGLGAATNLLVPDGSDGFVPDAGC